MTKFFIDQHGCAKNQVDAEFLISHLENLGLVQTFEPSEADIIIINSCGFIQSAKEESLNAVCAAKNDYPDAKIILAGCLAERYAQELNESLPEADAIFGNGNLEKIDEVIKNILDGKKSVVKAEQKGISCTNRKTFLSYRGSAYVKITEGCNNCCSFCAIPLIRGSLRSRKASEIVSEIKNLVSNGIVEINLIGQDLAAYGTGLSDDVFGNGREKLFLITEESQEKMSALACLLQKISEIPGNFRIRLLYIHPDHFDKNILSVMKNDNRFIPYFDIPFQSGDDNLIKKMNRIGSSAKYLNLVSSIRAVFPDAAIRTTFLTGFPGETEQMFSNTKAFLKELNASWGGSFSYSKEENTPSFSMKNQVSKKIAKERSEELIKLQAECTQNYLKHFVGTVVDVLIEEVLDGEDSFAIARAWFQAPEVDGSVVVRFDKEDSLSHLVKPGRFVKVRLDSVSAVDLSGILISDSLFNCSSDSEYVFAPEKI